ncbi:cysteine hydrolase family protein [Maridesulfovibrio salexigens]|uniref:Isochorismatase hydrolase n=1 Tax=Maridesulfovibrio salexigens (strain ATCC 14822 / DSM 2638 / NCIMB 8403 / VKM B-1763) TaxID=526222 RepID=C6BZX6_MARSD|nr:cysteine hydrolase family protein [Maridesulfovibrio salexigens]ACS79033.1 isochorismatase hydrolase [Maridesulfovibrio salexigens DSM 2638]
MSKKALVIIDIQNDYFPGGKFMLDNSEQAGANAAQVLEYFRKTAQPVIHIQHISVRKGSSFFLPETQGVMIHDCVKPLENETVINKNYPNSFRETNLDAKLKELGAEELVIIGMMSNMCIDATTRAAADMGYKCTIAHDACCGASLEFNGVKVGSADVHAGFMASLGMFYAQMVSAEELTS